MRPVLIAVTISLAVSAAAAPLAAQRDRTFTRADSIRGSLTSAERTWWDVTFYDLHVRINPSDSTIRGHNTVTYRILEPGTEMQIDLQVPLEVDSMVQDGAPVTFRRTVGGQRGHARPDRNANGECGDQEAGSVKLRAMQHGR